MAIAGPEDGAKVVVCGPRDGVAGLVASRLSSAGGGRKVFLADPSETLEQQVRTEDGRCVHLCLMRGDRADLHGPQSECTIREDIRGH